MKSQPKVTAGVICFNEEKNLTACIKSLINQSYKNIEIVISDNKSTDRSKKILLGIKKQYPQIKMNFFPKNFGVGRNVLKVLEMSSANFFFFISPGDLIDKNFVKECMLIHSEKNVVSVMSSVSQKNQKKEVNVINFRGIKNFNNLSAFKQANIIRTFNAKKKKMKFNLFMLGIFNKSVLLNVIKVFKRKDLVIWNDRLVLFLVCMSGKLHHINKVLYTKFVDKRTARIHMYLEKTPLDLNSINLTIKSIFSIKKSSLFIKIKFALIIIKIAQYKIKRNLLDFLGLMRKKTLKLIKVN